MKGLFLGGYYAALGNIKLSFVPIILCAGALLITGSRTVQELFIYLTIIAFPVNSMSGMRKETTSKWSQYMLTMPVRRTDIIKCKYLSYLLWTASGVLLAAAITALSVAIHHNLDLFYYGLRDVFSMFIMGTGLAITAGALFYFLAHIVHIEKSEAVLLLSLLGSVGAVIAIITLLHKLDLPFYANIGLFVCIYLALFAASYLITTMIYKKKEYQV